MNLQTADALVKTWHGHTQQGRIDDYEHANQMQKLLVELAPDAEHGIVASFSGDSEPPTGASWLSHEIIVLGDDCIYRLAGMEGVPDGAEEPVFSVAVVRVPFDSFKAIQVLDTRVPGREATNWARNWQFIDQGGRVGLELRVSCWEETGWKASDAVFVNRLIRALGWAVEELPSDHE